jgi:hypothetical protein
VSAQPFENGIFLPILDLFLDLFECEMHDIVMMQFLRG